MWRLRMNNETKWLVKVDKPYVCDSQRTSVYHHQKTTLRQCFVFVFCLVCEHLTAISSYWVLYKWDREKEWKIKKQNVTMTSFESAFHSTEMSSLEAWSVFARVTLQEEKSLGASRKHNTRTKRQSTGQLIHVKKCEVADYSKNLIGFTKPPTFQRCIWLDVLLSV